jgi:hypothetical protein
MTDVTPADTEFVHNTDLSPGERYLATVPRVRAVLHHPALLEAFERYDRIANSKQKVFRSTGVASLWLGTVSLVGIAAELLLAALAFPAPWFVTMLFELCALASIILALGPWLARTRTRWLVARFMTEQIRQWHFQMLLDGSLVSKAYAEPDDFEAERTNRWAQFMARVPSAEGAMNSFVDAESLDLHHPIKPYTDPATAEESIRAYNDLRIQKQLDYFKLKREDFAVRDEWSEAFARWTIFSALLLTAGQFILALIRGLTKTDALDPASESIFAAAMVLVILSAVVRVYRSAVALSAQRERYDTKWVRLVALRTAWHMAGTVPKKLGLIKDVELVEVEELREFLRQMRRASYLL